MLALLDARTINEVDQKNSVYSTQFDHQKKDFLDNAVWLFEKRRGLKVSAAESDPGPRYAESGKFNMELVKLKRSGPPFSESQRLIAPCNKVALILLFTARSVGVAWGMEMTYFVLPSEFSYLDRMSVGIVERRWRGSYRK